MRLACIALSHVAWTSGNRGDRNAMQALHEEALSTREQIFGREHPLTAESRADLAAVRFALQGGSNPLLILPIER